MENLSIINGILFYNGRAVETNGNSLSGNKELLIFSDTYAFLSNNMQESEEVVNDYIITNSIQNAEIKIINLTF